jgi:hypothetical protein
MVNQEFIRLATKYQGAMRDLQERREKLSRLQNEAIVMQRDVDVVLQSLMKCVGNNEQTKAVVIDGCVVLVEHEKGVRVIPVEQ